MRKVISALLLSLAAFLIITINAYAAPPTVTSSAATSVHNNWMTLNGEVTAIDDTSIDDRGFVWDTSTKGAPGDVAPAASGYANNWTESGTFGLGIFSHVITSLTSGQTIYWRACAKNNDGNWGYSSERSQLTSNTDRFWVGGTGSWSSTAKWSLNSGGASGASVPVSTNDVYFNAASAAAAMTITLSGITYTKDFDFSAVDDNIDFSGGTNIWVYGSVAMSNRIQNTSWGGIRFYGTGTVTLKMNGAYPSSDISIKSACHVDLQDNLSLKSLFGIETAGAVFDTNGYNLDLGFLGPPYSIYQSNGTIYLNGSTVILRSTAGFQCLQIDGGTMDLGSSSITGLGRWQNNGGTIVGGTSTITISTAAAFNGRGQTYYDVNLAGGLMTGANTFHNLTLTNSGGDKNSSTSLDSNITVTNIFTATGDGITDRLMVSSDDVTTTPTARTITAATVISSHVDYQYITGAGAGDWNLSSGGEDSIGYPGCTGLTFTYPYNINESMYWTGLQDGIAGSGTWDYLAGAVLGVNDYNWSTTSGGSGGTPRHYSPQITNDIYFDANSGFGVGNQTVTLGWGVGIGDKCKSMDWTGSNAVANPILLSNLGNTPLDVYGSITFVTGLDLQCSGTSSILTLKGSGANNITSNGVVFDSNWCLKINTGGTYAVQDNLYLNTGSAGAAIFEWIAGTFNLNNKTITSTVAHTVSFIGGSQTYAGSIILNISGDKIVTVTGSNNFSTLICNGGASYANAFKFAADQYIVNLGLHGYNNVYRLLFASSVAGTQRQCSVSGTTDVTNTNLSDSAKVGAADPDISAGDNSDYGGNLGWIFDTGFYIYWVGNSGNWSDLTNHWASTSGGTPGTGRVPLIQDIAVFDANSFTIPGRTVTIDITDLSGIDAIAATNSPTISKAGTVDIYGDIALGSLTWTVTTTNFKGLDTTLKSSATFTTNMYVLKNAGFMSSLILNGNVNVGGTIYVQSGIFNHGGFNVTAQYYDSSTTTYTRSIRLGSGVTELNGTSATAKWNMNATNLTFYCETSTIKLTNSTANAQTFTPASLTYYNIQVAGAGAYTLTIGSAFTANSVLFDRSVANKTIAGNYLITLAPSGLYFDLSGTRTVTITNTDFSMASGVVFGDYLVISGSSASGGASFFANVGGHSTDNGGNTGWIWTPPTAPTIQTNVATDVTYLGERLNGELLTKGSYVTFYCYFEYGPTVAYGFTTPETTKTAVGTFSEYLSPYKVYHFRAVVRFGLNDHAYGNDRTVSISGAVGQAEAAVSDPGQDTGTSLLTTVPGAIPRMYVEGATAGIPLAPLVDPALAESGTPVEVFWYPIAFAIAIIAGFAVYAGTRTLLMQAIVSGCVMAAFAGGGVLGDGLLPFWTVLLFLIEALLIWLIQEKQII